MKAVFKKAIPCITAILFLILNVCTFSALNKSSILSLATTNQSDNESEDGAGNDFNFIKSNENVRDFLYDGSLLLYGGTALVAISLIGMVVTFLPRKRKKKKVKKSDSDIHAQK